MLYTALSPHNPDFPCGCRRESRYPCHDFEFTSGEASGGMRFCCAPLGHPGLSNAPPPPQSSAQCTRKMGFGFSRTAFLLPLIIIIPRLCLTVPGGAVVASVSVTARIPASTSPLHAMRYGGRKQLAAVCSLGCCACIYSRGPHGAFSRACPPKPLRIFELEPGAPSWIVVAGRVCSRTLQNPARTNLRVLLLGSKRQIRVF